MLRIHSTSALLDDALCIAWCLVSILSSRAFITSPCRHAQFSTVTGLCWFGACPHPGCVTPCFLYMIVRRAPPVPVAPRAANDEPLSACFCKDPYPRSQYGGSGMSGMVARLEKEAALYSLSSDAR